VLPRAAGSGVENPDAQLVTGAICVRLTPTRLIVDSTRLAGSKLCPTEANPPVTTIGIDYAGSETLARRKGLKSSPRDCAVLKGPATIGVGLTFVNNTRRSPEPAIRKDYLIVPGQNRRTRSPLLAVNVPFVTGNKARVLAGKKGRGIRTRRTRRNAVAVAVTNVTIAVAVANVTIAVTITVANIAITITNVTIAAHSRRGVATGKRWQP
jgi:hypothetical protein